MGSSPGIEKGGEVTGEKRGEGGGESYTVPTQTAQHHQDSSLAFCLSTSLLPGSKMPVGPPWERQLVPNVRQSWLIVALAALLVHSCFSLEVSVGKNPQVKARNGTDIYLPCIFTTCIGFEDVTFSWEYRTFNLSSVAELLYHGKLKNKKSAPKPIEIVNKNYRHDRLTLVPSNETKDYNLTLLLKEVEFDDAGRYTCIVTNKKEKDTKSNATVFLTVVDKFEVVDNTLTVIIASVVGGVIGLLILILIIKKAVSFALKKNDKKKDCLVSSSVNDNTDNASKQEAKAKAKPKPKA